MSKLKNLFINPTIGTVTLTDGEKTFDVPKLDMSKVIRVVKFLGTDGTKVYSQAREVLLNDELGTFERIASVIEGLEEEQLFQLIAIVMDLPVEEALKFDLNETLDVLIVISENTNLSKTYTQIRVLADKLFDMKLPDLKDVLAKGTAPRKTPDSEVISEAATTA